MAIADFKQMATEAAQAANVPVGLFLGLVQQESNWNQYALSPAGAYGLGQLMPDTATELGVNPYDARSNLNGSARYLRQQYETFGNWSDALGGYNAGPGAWGKVLAGTRNAPAETTDYITKVGGYARSLFGFDIGSPAGAQLPAISPPSSSGYTTYVRDGSGAVIGANNGGSGAPLKVGVFGANPIGDILSTIGAPGANLPDVEGTDDISQTGKPNLINGADISFARLFDPEFWKGSLVDIIAVLAIIALVLFGVLRVIKPGK